MNESRDDFLPRTGFPLQQNGRVRVGDLRGLLQDVLPLGGVSDRTAQAGLDIELFGEHLDTRCEVLLARMRFSHATLGHGQLFVRNGQGDVVGDPASQRDIVLRKRSETLRVKAQPHPLLASEGVKGKR